MKDWLPATLIAFSLAVFLAPSTVRAQSTNELRIVAVVNDDVISAYDLASRIEIVIALSNVNEQPGVRKQLAHEILRTLITERLRLQEAERLGIDVDAESIERAIRNVEKRNGIPPGQLPNILERRNLDIESVIQQLRAEIAWARSIVRNFSARVNVTDDEVDRVVDELNDAIGKPEYNVMEIYLSVDDPSQTVAVRQRAQQLTDQLNGGASFPAIAQTFSDNPTARTGGALGWVRQGQLPSEVARHVVNLQPGQVVGPIDATGGGFYIIGLRDRRIAGRRQTGAVTVTLSQLHLSLPADAPQDTVEDYVRTARDKTSSLQGCEAMEQLGESFGSPLSGNLGTLPIDRLPPPLREAILRTPVGGVTEPIRSQDAVVVLMVCDRTDPQVETVEVDRDAVQRRLFDQRLDIYARQYMRDLRRAAYIEIR